LGSTMAKYYQVIDTLQPDLQWKDIKSQGQTYDVCVWETPSSIQDEAFFAVLVMHRSWGEQVCYVESISENHYKVPKQLKPKTCYHWSVRTRSGNNVSEWASFSQSMVGFVIGHEGNIPYGFITPEK
ncbi:MAG TPA: hypothetical protein VEF34_11330, partial [Syntrophobacteraceae bacterium]|nr:hypothetical protein [Syntrophobacteraceae bacterium]